MSPLLPAALLSALAICCYAYPVKQAVAIDFETAHSRPDSAVAVGLVWIGGPYDGCRFYSLVRPVKASTRFTRLHGIDVATQNRAPNFATVWRQIAPYLGKTPTFVAHNAAFDRGVLRVMAEQSVIALPHHRFLCTLNAARRRYPNVPCDLRNVAARLGIAMRNKHHALYDAIATARIASILLPQLDPARSG